MKQCFVLLFFLIATSNTINLFSQVTIGSTLTPNDGAILDLKMFQNGTSNLGLGLPRVDLVHPNSLVPCVSAQAEAIAGVKGNHVGLVVYQSISPCVCREMPMYNATYVWDGTTWSALNEIQKPEIFYYVDQRNGDVTHTYPYRKFGDAGYWMLQNLRAKKQDHKRTDPIGDPISQHPTESHQDLTFSWVYPKRVIADGSTLYDADNSLGLLYSFYTVVNNKPATNLENNPVQSPPIQGICPYGWHVPSDLEFTLLETELSKNHHLYSTLRPTAPIQNIQLGVTGWRGNAQAMVMKETCVVQHGDATWVGCATSLTYGGFNAKAAGYSNNGEPNYYGRIAFFRTSSRTERQFGTTSTGVYRSDQPDVIKYSVRCMKNNN